jgi:hypothetical protein
MTDPRSRVYIEFAAEPRAEPVKSQFRPLVWVAVVTAMAAGLAWWLV